MSAASAKIALFVMLGGAIGSLSRHMLGSLLANRWSNPFPLSTFLVNVGGCFLIGIFYKIFINKDIDHEWSFFLMTGFCGGFTTFSAFALESVKLFQEGNSLTFLLYSSVSYASSLTAVVIGFNVGKIILKLA